MYVLCIIMINGIFFVQTRDLNIKLKPQQITTLSDDIRRTIDSLTNIENILDETSNDLDIATQLKSNVLLNVTLIDSFIPLITNLFPEFPYQLVQTFELIYKSTFLFIYPRKVDC